VSPDASVGRWPGRIAVGVVRWDPPEVVLAENEYVLARALALEVVARTDPTTIDGSTLERIREALLDEDWATAVGEWISATGYAVDGYPDEPVWTERQLDEETASMEIRMARIFSER
jgi:hypothetical protein